MASIVLSASSSVCDDLRDWIRSTLKKGRLGWDFQGGFSISPLFDLLLLWIAIYAPLNASLYRLLRSAREMRSSRIWISLVLLQPNRSLLCLIFLVPRWTLRVRYDSSRLIPIQDGGFGSILWLEAAHSL